jgi:hypothetical protein
MAVNVNNVERKMFKFYEGLCSSADFTKEIAKVLALGVKTEAVKDTDGNILENPLIVQSKNWDIVYPVPDGSLNLDLENLTIEEYKAKILNQVSKISDTVILKTTTTPKELAESKVDDLTVDSDSNKADLTMYLEIYKPTYIANPEEYPLDCERSGIIPKLITKELYEESLKTQHATEENIYTIASVDKKDDPTTGSIELKYSECDAYVSKINNIYGDMSFSVPSTDGSTTSIVINAAYLTKIKQDDAELYELILNTLDGGEGIEPKTYSLLNNVTLEIVREDDIYTMMFEGVKKLTTYTISKGTEYTVKHVPAEKLTPEYYLDGVYTPIDASLYHVDGKRIIFDDNITFEASSEGVLVVRYTYDTTSNAALGSVGTGNSIISDRVTLLNNHYVLMRLFDNINNELNGPMDNVYNASGEIVQTNSHISPWSKLSWYQDFEEVMIDTIDSDVSISSVHDGTVFVPLETAGLNADTKIRYWINTNNDRFSVVVMGNPSLDYEKDRHLISGCYCGRIESFDNSINDTAGNFALFTSSSTEPCNTVLNTEQVTYDMQNYTLSEAEVKNKTYDEDEFNTFVANSPWNSPCTNSQIYYIQLTDKTYFNREKWPKYVIVDATGAPVTPLTSAYKRSFIMNEGKADVLQLTVEPDHAHFDDTHTIIVSFGYYQEKFIITSGVARDVFGNVIDVDKVKDYGANTSDGVTSIMMYHTRSKAYYQKHHMLFATTEEYMSKVMYGKSSYTGEYYADRIKITHSNDGPRGTLDDILVIDSSSLYALDELVINKDFEKDPDEYEETFIFFPITAPYSPLSDSPNARYGLAIKKEEVEPRYTDEEIILKLAMQSLSNFTEHWKNVESDIYPRDMVDACSVYWKEVEGSAWIGDENTPSAYSPIQLAVVNTSEYQGDLESPIAPTSGVTLEQGSVKTDVTKSMYSYLKISGFEPTEGEMIAYGISDKPIGSFGKDAQLKVVLYDGTAENDEFEYNIQGVPYTADIGAELPTDDIQLIDAAPSKYLILYSVKEEEVESQKKYTISKFACVPLKDSSNNAHWLLQYPCSVNAYIDGGRGTMIYNKNRVNSITDTVNYGEEVTISFNAADGFKLKSVTLVDADTLNVIKTISDEKLDDGSDADEGFISIVADGVTYKGITIESVTNNMQIKVSFAVNA